MCEETKDLVTEAAIDTNETVAETMDDLKEDLEKSYQKVQEGDILTGTVIGVSDTEVTVDLRSYAEGIIKAEELSNNPKFSISTDIAVGEAVTCIVLRADDGEGNLLLSKKKADDILAWERLQNLMDEGTVLSVKICGVVNGGVITYVEGIRGFIPASQLSLSYVEDLNTFLNETVDAKVITVDKSKKRLVLSAKEVAKAKAAADKSAKINRVQVGDGHHPVIDLVRAAAGAVHIGDGGGAQGAELAGKGGTDVSGTQQGKVAAPDGAHGKLGGPAPALHYLGILRHPPHEHDRHHDQVLGPSLR